MATDLSDTPLSEAEVKALEAKFAASLALMNAEVPAGDEEGTGTGTGTGERLDEWDMLEDDSTTPGGELKVNLNLSC